MTTQLRVIVSHLSFLSLYARNGLVCHVRKYFCKIQRKNIKERNCIQRIKRRKEIRGDGKIDGISLQAL